MPDKNNTGKSVRCVWRVEEMGKRSHEKGVKGEFSPLELFF